MASTLEKALALTGTSQIWIHQRMEAMEFLGIETRNKYEIRDHTGESLGFVVEQQKGLLGFLLRQSLGHWRSFEMHFYTLERQLLLTAQHPFRWFLSRVEVQDSLGFGLGTLQRRFSIFSKRFDVEDPDGNVLMTVSSPLWRPWTFKFMRQSEAVGQVTKKWTGLFAEGFTDKDKFLIQFGAPNLSQKERSLILCAAVFIDLLFFEKKA